MTPYGYGFGYPLSVGGPSAWTPAMLGSSLKLWLKPESLENPNLLGYSNNLAQAPWVQNGSMSAIGGQTDPLGGSTAWLCSATSSFHPLTHNSPTWQVGEDYTNSLWIKRGPLHNGTDKVRHGYRDGTTLTLWLQAVPPVEWTRVSGTTTNVAGTASQFYLYPTQGTSADNAVYVWHPQMEQNDAVTDYVDNPTAAVGGIVAEWPDSSGSANDATQGTQASMPLVEAEYLDALSGCVDDGVDDQLDLDTTLVNHWRYAIIDGAYSKDLSQATYSLVGADGAVHSEWVVTDTELTGATLASLEDYYSSKFPTATGL